MAGVDFRRVYAKDVDARAEALGQRQKDVLLPGLSKIGRADSTASESPPIMMERVPWRAPTSPPDTGASMAATPRDAAAPDCGQGPEHSPNTVFSEHSVLR